MGTSKEGLVKRKEKKMKLKLKSKQAKTELLQKDVNQNKKEERNEALIEKKKRKRNKGNGVFGEDSIQINEEKQIAEHKNKKNKERKKKQKSNEAADYIGNLGGETEDASRTEIKDRKLKKSKKKKIKHDTSKDDKKILENRETAEEEDFYHISSGDEDSSKGMKKWLTEYHQSRPGLQVLQQRIDEFMIAHEEKVEQERKEREARAAEDGWTVVTHHKGRKKTTDSESGIVVGSVAQAVVEDRMAKKKHKEVDLDFYRFQKRENQRNEIMMLQSKFEQDKKRIQQLRAARKFRPY